MSEILILNEQEVVDLLDMPGCVAAMTDALSSLARGEVHLPLRPVIKPPGESTFLGLMPVHRAGDHPVYALKTIVIVHDNPTRGLDPHQGMVTLHDGVTGQLVAMMNASPITAIRTAGCSGVATRALAREESRILAVVGAGHQAHAHIEAMLVARPFEEIRIASRTRASAEKLAAEFETARAADSVEDAVRGADVVVLVTNAHDPVIRRDWLKAGAHVNAVGACLPSMRELDAATVADSAFFVDRRESAEQEAGDYILALADGAIRPGHIRAEIGEVLIGKAQGRASDHEITVFESLGLAVEDLFAGEYVLRRARETGAGTRVAF